MRSLPTVPDHPSPMHPFVAQSRIKAVDDRSWSSDPPRTVCAFCLDSSVGSTKNHPSVLSRLVRLIRLEPSFCSAHNLLWSTVIRLGSA
ncbi:unnamed protein product [Arabis nemorensis]|uniref:Uncharacterized protein n=1 Tax=Arabis nemorensis TaxID=586526 RepID=A0A565CBZ7_9BRAS|nr:unnamed protein product [Arabis nemorensis]